MPLCHRQHYSHVEASAKGQRCFCCSIPQEFLENLIGPSRVSCGRPGIADICWSSSISSISFITSNISSALITLWGVGDFTDDKLNVSATCCSDAQFVDREQCLHWGATCSLQATVSRYGHRCVIHCCYSALAYAGLALTCIRRTCMCRIDCTSYSSCPRASCILYWH